ncbi:hypothetical protein SK128_000493 [Halocaridina rubra]|uniref:Uncharacterized protein n=1 Tax=Halocaridina rubra TaxID=373956 RepID=A0AAN8X1C2_HALRR
MDEEGYPRLIQVEEPAPENPYNVAQSMSTRYLSEDRESGERTNRQVMTLRRPMRTVTLRRSTIKRQSNSDFHKALELHWRLVTLTHAFPGFHTYQRTCAEMNCDASRNTASASFRIPNIRNNSSERRFKQKKEINVSVWKECAYGDRLFDVKTAEVAAHRKKGCLVVFASRYLENYLPCFFIKLVVFLLVVLRCVLCNINVPIIYLYRSRQHEKIHLKCEEKGIKPVFTGSVCHGPLIWSVRHLTCQYCRAQRQSDISLKLLEIMNKERRNALSVQ